MRKLFRMHPQSIGETYVQHLLEAAYCGLIMLFSGVICIIHAIFPFLFITTASKRIVYLVQRFESRHNKRLK